jgi:hypothetical protein
MHPEAVEFASLKMVRSSQMNSPVREFVIGIDLGTSCTKVVIQDLSSTDAWAVPLGDLFSTALGRFLLPTAIEVSPTGAISIGDSAHAIRDLKLRLLLPDTVSNASRGDPLVYLVCYLALVMRTAARWFVETNASLLGAAKPLWEVNIGMPASSLDDGALKSQYSTLCRAAWSLSRTTDEVSLSSAKRTLTSAGLEPSEELSSLGIVPEVVGQMIGYARSPLRRDGLHLLIDVGAGTLDVLMFNLHRPEGEDRFSILQADVRPLGAIVLHAHRLAGLNGLGVEIKKTVVRLDGRSGLVPGGVDDYVVGFQRLAQSTSEVIASIDREFEDRCFKVVHAVMRVTQERRYPTAPEWRPNYGLETFLTGGGARVKFYQRLFERLKKNALQRGTMLRPSPLPRPLRFEAPGLNAADFDRLSVAHGLSFTTLNLGAIELPSQIEDIRGDSELDRRIEEMARRAVTSGYDR